MIDDDWLVADKKPALFLSLPVMIFIQYREMLIMYIIMRRVDQSKKIDGGGESARVMPDKVTNERRRVRQATKRGTGPVLALPAGRIKKKSKRNSFARNEMQ